MDPNPDPRYPVPDRSNFSPNQRTNDPILREGDIGASRGVLPDGRPYQLEGWYAEGITMVTIFFSKLDLEDARAPALLELVSGLLAEAEVPEPNRRLVLQIAEDSWGSGHTIEDASGNIMYSLTFVVGNPY